MESREKISQIMEVAHKGSWLIIEKVSNFI
jgi:hypothetical protein